MRTATAAAAEALAREIGAAGGEARAVCFDVTDAQASKQALERILGQAPIQILVNNAGIHEDAPFPGMSAVQWQSVIDVALKGFYNVTQPLMLPMIRTRWGRIVSISSVAALMGNRGQVNYAAAKGALNAATKALSLEVARRGVTVNAVAPGIIASGMSTPVFDAATIERSYRCAGRAPRRRSRVSWPISPLRRRATSPDRSSRSTAAWPESRPERARRLRA